MQTKKEKLGKVTLTIAKDPWNINNVYSRLTLVIDEVSRVSYVSRQKVPSNVSINNREYWLPLNNNADFSNYYTKDEADAITNAINNKLVPATLETIGLVKPYTKSVGGVNTNRSGLNINADGEINVNVPASGDDNIGNYGLYRDGSGQLKASIKRSATAEDLSGIGSAGATEEAAITPANIGGAVKTVNGQSIVGQGNITIEGGDANIGYVYTDSTFNDVQEAFDNYDIVILVDYYLADTVLLTCSYAAVAVEYTFNTVVNADTILSRTIGENGWGELQVVPIGGSNVQSDWNQNNPNAADYIKNKPTIPDVSAAEKNRWNDDSIVKPITANSPIEYIEEGLIDNKASGFEIDYETIRYIRDSYKTVKFTHSERNVKFALHVFYKQNGALLFDELDMPESLPIDEFNPIGAALAYPGFDTFDGKTNVSFWLLAEDETTLQYVTYDSAEPALLIGSGNIDGATKQDKLVSGTNIKTVNGNSILGSGNIVIEGGSAPSPATTTDLGVVKLHTSGTTNRSGLLIDGGGGLSVNINSNNGGYIDGAGQLHTNIERSATADDIAAIGTGTAPSAAAITAANLPSVLRTINGENVYGSGNIDTQQVFVAKYNTTAIEDIVSAYNANKIVICDYTLNGSFYGYATLTSINTAEGFESVTFEAVFGTSAYSLDKVTILVNSSSTWSKTSIYLQQKLTSGTTIKTVNGQSLLGSGNISIESGGDNVAIVTTSNTQSEIEALYDAGKMIVLKYTGNNITEFLPLADTTYPYDANPYFSFSGIVGTNKYDIELLGDSWGTLVTTILADGDDVPTELSQLSGDSTHRTVTDVEKAVWNNKQDSRSFTTIDTSDTSYASAAALSVGTDYYVAGNLNTYTFNLADAPTDGIITALFKTSTTPAITFATTATVYAQEGLEIEADSYYEVNIRAAMGEYYIVLVKMEEMV